MKQHKLLLASLTMAALLLSGCATAAGSASTPANVSTPAAPPETGNAGNHGGGHNAGGSSSPEATIDGPSDAALMVCGKQPMDRLKSILDLDADPHTANDWADNTFTCTYHLDEGALKISVKEDKDQATARTTFDAMQGLAKDAKPIEGLANLGFPAYETADGSAVFQKDSFVLHVDGTNLPATLGPENITRNALAYQLSTTILACWVEHP
ncbi:hypothetical protein [Pseudarthrobacter oxydans]|jgi:hypothetical protein|uniref:hypothetical protein n=1 Tax=Pseudarthrobacter oxydans TaxID=1671 RepID=UPI00343689B5